MHLLRTLYYLLFDSHLIYPSEIWGQNQTNKVLLLCLETITQDKAITIINFQPQTSSPNNLFKEKQDL